MKLTRLLKPLALIAILSASAAFAEEEFKPPVGCPPDTDCCQFGPGWQTKSETKVYAGPDGKKAIGKLKKREKVTTTEGKFTPVAPRLRKAGKSEQGSWWVKVKLADGTSGWVDGHKFEFDSRCPSE